MNLLKKYMTWFTELPDGLYSKLKNRLNTKMCY